MTDLEPPSHISRSRRVMPVDPGNPTYVTEVPDGTDSGSTAGAGRPDRQTRLPAHAQGHEEDDRPRGRARERDRAGRDLGPPAEDDERHGQVPAGGEEGERRRRAAEVPGRAEGRADDRLRVLRRPRLADLSELRLFRRGAAGTAPLPPQ